MKIFILRWLIGWCKIIDGLVMVLSFNFMRPSLTLWMATIYSKEKWVSKNK